MVSGSIAAHQQRSIEMTSQIRDIRYVYKSGAHGDPSKYGQWIYGRRPDGRTVGCNFEMRADGSVVISSTWRSPACAPGEVETCETEFAAAEWMRLTSRCREPTLETVLDDLWMQLEGNRILDGRK